MPRVRMIDDRKKASSEQVEVFDHIAASRGAVRGPFAAMLHRPEIARATADLGTLIRFDGTLTDHDREVVICAVAFEHSCGFEWQAHLPLARDAGVDQRTLNAIEQDGLVEDGADAGLVEFVRESCRSGEVSDHTFGDVLARFGEAGAVELAATVGYYRMLATFMKACDVC